MASFGTLQDKSIIDEVGRALTNKYKKTHPHEAPLYKNNPYSLEKIKIIKKEFVANPEATKKKYPDIFYYFDGLLDVKVSQSVHPAGMVISPISLSEYYGVFNKDGEQCLMMDMDEAHEVGAAKYDFLVLKTVQVIRDTCNYIGIPYPKTHEVDWNDEKVWKSIADSALCIFQFESAYAFECIRKYKPKNLFEMTLVNACIRPSGKSYRDELLARKPNSNPSQMIDDLLKENNGYLVYQEDVIKFLQQICGLSGSEADNIRRAIARKQQDRLEKAMPRILDGYCSKSDKDRETSEKEARTFIQILEDSASYMFGYNHAMAYCMLGYLCAYYRYHYPLEFITAFLNNAANDEDIQNGTLLAKLKNIQIIQPKFGFSKGNYFYNKDSKVISKGVSSIKHLSANASNELFELSQQKSYENFSDLLFDISHHTCVDARQLDILIKIDYFNDFGNQRELLAINNIFETFKKGEAKQIKKEQVAGTQFEEIIQQYANGKTKAGKDAKSYSLIDPMAIIRGCETKILSLGLQDLSLPLKARNFADIMGYAGYITNNPDDRNKLYVREVYPVKRKKDNVVFGHSVIYYSLGNGVSNRMTVLNNKFDKDPIKKDDIIICKSWERQGKYFRLLNYEHLYA